MNQNYEVMKPLLGSTLEHTVNELIKLHNSGRFVKTKFNGVTLYSDTVTMDDAHLKITGKTKAEFDSYLKEYFSINRIKEND